MADERVRQCAATLMDTFHTMMRTVGGEMRRRQSPILSFQQFRAAKTIQDYNGASLSHVAEHLGYSLSAASKLVYGLVERGYVRRETAEDDRRKVVLAISPAGEGAVDLIHQEGMACLAEKLASLSSSECAMLDLAMDILRSKLLATGRVRKRREPYA